jgi:hypothetical protein
MMLAASATALDRAVVARVGDARVKGMSVLRMGSGRGRATVRMQFGRYRLFSDLHVRAVDHVRKRPADFQPCG